MFYDIANDILSQQGKSYGWRETARQMEMTANELRIRIAKKNLTLEESLKLVRAAKSVELLNYVLHFINPEHEVTKRRLN